MDSVTSLVDLAAYFDSKVEDIKKCLQLRDVGRDSTAQITLKQIDRDLSEMAVTMALMRNEVAKGKESLAEFETLKQDVFGLQSRINYAGDHIPERLPQRQVTEQNRSGHNSNGSYESVPCTPLQPVQFNHLHEPVQTSSAQMNSGQVKKKRKPPIPTIGYLTVDEFAGVPKYMKGRIPYDTVNTAIEELNKAVNSKYTILAKPRNAQNEPTKRKIQAFKEQENKDTKGVFFFTNGDTKDYSNFKMDSNGRSILTILRHCGRLREVRGGGLTRYCVCI